MKFIWDNLIKPIGFLLRYIEVLLCIRKTPYKKHTFKKNPYSEYYNNKLKFKKPYA